MSARLNKLDKWQPGQGLALRTQRVQSTRAFGKQLAKRLAGGTILALYGELGAGKTCFVQGLAEGLEVLNTTEVLSPTYALCHEYPGRNLTLFHLDWYRLASAEAVVELGLLEHMGEGNAITAIEWADRFPDLLPAHAIWVHFTHMPEGGRLIELSNDAPRVP